MRLTTEIVCLGHEMDRSGGTSGGGLISDTSTSRKNWNISSKGTSFIYKTLVYSYVIYIQDKDDDMQ